MVSISDTRAYDSEWTLTATNTQFKDRRTGDTFDAQMRLQNIEVLDIENTGYPKAESWGYSNFEEPQNIVMKLSIAVDSADGVHCLVQVQTVITLTTALNLKYRKTIQ